MNWVTFKLHVPATIGWAINRCAMRDCTRKESGPPANPPRTGIAYPDRVTQAVGQGVALNSEASYTSHRCDYATDVASALVGDALGYSEHAPAAVFNSQHGSFGVNSSPRIRISALGAASATATRVVFPR